MDPAVFAKPLLPDKPSGARKCRPQPLCHPRLETYPEPLLKELSTYCYTCESRAVGAEALLHLYFGELGCNHCFHNIKSCSDFRNQYPMVGLCKGSGGEHNACRWVAPTCKYVMYNTRKTLSVARCINNKFEKQEVFSEATTYLRALLPLRGLYPWRSALKTIAKAGIAVDLSNCPPRLEPLHPSQAGRAVGKGMLGVSGLLNLEKSILHLEKRNKLRDGPARMQNNPGSAQNDSAHTHTTHSNTEDTQSSTGHPSNVNSTPAGTESSPAPVDTLKKSLNKIKQKSRTFSECNILTRTENSSTIQTHHKLQKKGKSRSTDTTTEYTLPSTQTENSPVSMETPHECHKKDVKKNCVCVQPQNHFSETPKPRKKARVEDASAENHQEERKDGKLKDTFISVTNTAAMPQGTFPPRAKKRTLEVPSTTTDNTALTHPDILPHSTEIKEETQLKHIVADMEITALPIQENAVNKKHKKKIKNSLKVGNKSASAEDVLPDDAFSVCVDNTASRKQGKRRAESFGGPEPPGASALPLCDTLPPSANISPKKHKKRKQKNAPEVEQEATSVQDISPDNIQLGSEESSTGKTHKRRKLRGCDNVTFEVGAQDPFPVTSLPNTTSVTSLPTSAENTTSKKHKRRELKSHDDDTESEAAPK